MNKLRDILSDKPAYKIIIIGAVALILTGVPVLSYFNSKLPKPAGVREEAKQVIEIKVYKSENGWGYDIYVNKKITIHQPIVPAFSGNNGFATEEDAKKVAELVVSKMKKESSSYPTLLKKELTGLGIKER